MIEVELRSLNLIKDLIPILSLEGEVPREQNIHKDSQRPNIALLSVLPIDDFWSHIIWCACDSCELRMLS